MKSVSSKGQVLAAASVIILVLSLGLPETLSCDFSDSMETGGELGSMLRLVLADSLEYVLLIGTVTGLEVDREVPRIQEEYFTRVYVNTDETLFGEIEKEVALYQGSAIYQDEDGEWMHVQAPLPIWCFPGDRLLLLVRKSKQRGQGFNAFPEFPIRYARLIQTAESGEELLRSIEGTLLWDRGMEELDYEEQTVSAIQRRLEPETESLPETRERVKFFVERLTERKSEQDE